MDELDQGTWSTPASPDTWSAGDEDDSVEVFVFGGDDDAEPTSGPAAPTGHEEGFTSTLTPDDVAGDDWNDEGWLQSLDSFETVDDPGSDTIEPTAAATQPAPAAAPDPAPTTAPAARTTPVPAPSAFVDTPTPAAGIPGERLDEALQTIEESGARTGPVDDADVADLLRELSMLSGD